MKKNLFLTAVLAIMLVFGLAFIACDNGNGDNNGDGTQTVATPTATPAGGTYGTAQSVTLACSTSRATIHYTTNGNTPTTSSTEYTTAINISTTTTLKAIAVKSGMNNSTVFSATYTITAPKTDADDFVLGETGPGGGKIFYVNKTGFTVYQNATDTVGVTCHYLEAAPADMPTALRWSTATSYPYSDITGTATGVGTGKKNTALILATDSAAPAAKACNEYTNNGKSDWFLPSKGELQWLNSNKVYVGNLKTTYNANNRDYYYWSSSQHASNSDWSLVILLYGGTDASEGKASSYSVRAIRAF